MRNFQSSVCGWIVVAGCGAAPFGCGPASRTEGLPVAAAHPFAETPQPKSEIETVPALPAATTATPSRRSAAAHRVDDHNAVAVWSPASLHAYPGRQLATVEARQAPTAVTSDEVVAWSSAGMRDDVIIDRIERSDAVFRLTAGEELSLRQQGVSEDVIYAMKETRRR